ncbi:MAG: hypothetical protein UX10_C0027G0005 [Candidatus Magasanikbacteria bacterium GW2011_GWA2_45_39]|uniref:Uncharacterized protein n=1 Tax=Candidatus Magasanikbacteria bacterium GW2011_GWA2_45_39 TaxID=1619041 RepID=A0A0G1MEB1_9BACT|nr:MAG: hypothetical protein UX10_C0027G0005 [Candidatus Magasanikbacteria bacterium GW2011_GWA2_45_39]
MNDLPYVVSGDIERLLKKWAIKHEFTLPDHSFFQALRERFAEYMRSVFPAFELVSEDELATGLNELVRESSLPIVALDETYIDGSPMRLRLTRTVDEDLRDAGIASRFPEVKSPEGQIMHIASVLKKSGHRTIALVDDVIFSGALIDDVCFAFNYHGIDVKCVYAGIGIAQGVWQVSASGRSVQCVRSYKHVIDQICERDFYPGVPLSGRTLYALRSNGRSVGVPYFYRSDKLEKWASIPSHLRNELSRMCISQTIDLFEAIGDMSGRPVRANDLDRYMLRSPLFWKEKDVFVDELLRENERDPDDCSYLTT